MSRLRVPISLNFLAALSMDLCVASTMSPNLRNSVLTPDRMFQTSEDLLPGKGRYLRALEAPRFECGHLLRRKR